MNFALLAVLAVLVFVLVYYGYQHGWFNAVLPTDYQKSGFVGAYARSPDLQGLIVRAPSGAVMFNRGTHV